MDALDAQLGELEELGGQRARSFEERVPLGRRPDSGARERLAPVPEPFRRNLASIAGDEARTRVLLMGTDPLERSWLARALVCEGLDVRSSETVLELRELLGNEDVRLAVVDMERPDALLMLGVLAEIRPGPAVVVCARDPEDAMSAVRAFGFAMLRVYASRTPPRELVERIRDYAASAASSGSATLEAEASLARVRLQRVPCHVVAPDDVGWFAMGLEPAAASFLACVDGKADVDVLARRCGLSPSQALCIAEALAEQGVILLE
jgi:hypothetical protein